MAFRKSGMLIAPGTINKECEFTLYLKGRKITRSDHVIEQDSQINLDRSIQDEISRIIASAWKACHAGRRGVRLPVTCLDKMITLMVSSILPVLLWGAQT